MREPDSWIVGLAVAVALWFSALVAFSVGILVAPVSSIVAGFAAIGVFSALVFFLGLTWGKGALRQDRLAWRLAATGWLVPWIGVFFRVQGLSEDLGGALGACVSVALVIVVIPVSLIWLGLQMAGRRNKRRR
jgi:hypothetical protein